MKRIIINLPAALAELLRARAYGEKVSQAEIMRRALEAYLSKK